MLSNEAILYYANHPVEFVQDILKADPDPEQKKILRSLVTNQMTSVRSGHGIGKSAVEAWSVIWFMCTHPYPKIPCTAPTQHQLFDILWAEISKWKRNNKTLDSELIWTKEKLYMKPGTWYYLKLDISKYFYRISHEVLKEILARKIKDQQLLQVLYNIIDCQHTPFGLPPGKGPGEVPLEERLYDVGMPVGNLLSQVFANIYLDALDQFCKRTLCIHFYVRYMDDIIILSDSKEQLHMWKDEIQKFVETTLRLSLNQKTCIRPISQGIEFVGYRIWPHYVTIRKSTTLEMKRHLRRKVEEYNAGLIEMEVVTATLKSYLGMLDHCDCKEFRKELIDSVVLDRNKVVGEIAYEVENYSEAMVCGL